MLPPSFHTQELQKSPHYPWDSLYTNGKEMHIDALGIYSVHIFVIEVFFPLPDSAAVLKPHLC